jgi:hypothetical protein
MASYSDYLNYITNNLTNINGGGYSSDTAYLDGNPLPFEPNSLSWEYDLVTAAFDTIGGRVLQVISTNIQTMTFDGDAGSRANLLSLYTMIKNLQDQQIQTWQSSTLTIPSRNWNFLVWVRALPQMGWNVQTTTYPYRITFEVDEDFGNISTAATGNAMANALSLLNSNVGYNPASAGVGTNVTSTSNTSASN